MRPFGNDGIVGMKRFPVSTGIVCQDSQHANDAVRTVHTFLRSRRRRRRRRVRNRRTFLGIAVALGMNPSRLAGFPTLFALRNRASFLLDLKQWPVVMMATGGAMAFDA